jgi:hypothetical protein
VADQLLGELFCGLGGEEGGVGVYEFFGLLCHRGKHARMLMSEAGHGSTPGGIQHLAAVLGKQPDALAADGFRRRLAQASMQHAAMFGGHDDQPFSETYCEVAASRASVSSRRFLATVPPNAKVAAASDCAIAIAPVRLGKNPGEDADS